MQTKTPTSAAPVKNDAVDAAEAVSALFEIASPSGERQAQQLMFGDLYKVIAVEHEPLGGAKQVSVGSL